MGLEVSRTGSPELLNATQPRQSAGSVRSTFDRPSLNSTLEKSEKSAVPVRFSDSLKKASKEDAKSESSVTPDSRQAQTKRSATNVQDSGQKREAHEPTKQAALLRNSVQSSAWSEEKEVEAPQDIPVYFKPSPESESQPNVAALKGQETDEAAATAAPSVSEQEAMAKFITSMQNELGVEPEEILQAFRSLSSEDLLKSPDETMEIVIAELDLTPVQQVRASELYQTMLKETAEASMKDWAQSANSDVELQVLGPDEAKKHRLNKSIEKMNTNFFMKDPAQVEAQRNEERRASVTSVGIAPAAAFSSSSNGRTQLGTPSPGKAQKASFFGEPSTSTALSTSDGSLSSASSADQPLFPVEIEAADEADLALASTEEGLKDLSDLGSEIEKLLSDIPETANESQAPMAGDFAAVSASTETSSQNSGRSPGRESKRDDSAPEQQIGSASPIGMATAQGMKNPETNSSFVVNSAVDSRMKPSDEASNVRQMIQGAQYLIQKGGGEMKVQMNPEGMGSVDLKVALNNGKVEIQMFAENNETKRLLESGLSDLRESLSGAKLNVDTLKVDLAQKTQQSPMNGQLYDQQREAARDFFWNFRQNSQNNRQNFMDATVLRGYSKNNKALRPEDVEVSSTSSSNSRRLNLVA